METTHILRGRVRILALALIAVLLLAACGGSDDDKGSDNAANTSNDANTNAVVEAHDAADDNANANTSADDSAANNADTMSDTSADNTVENTEANAANDAVQPAAPALLPGQRDAPVPVSAGFVNDPASLVGATGKPQLVEFFTYWCSTCKSIKPEIHSLEAEYFGAVDFVYLDREDGANKTLVDELGIFGQPVLVLVDAEGNELQRWFGYVDTDDLRAAFADALAS